MTLARTNRPDRVHHSDETVLAIMRCRDLREVRAICPRLGVSPNVAKKWFSREQKRAVLLAAQHGLQPRDQKPKRFAAPKGERALIRAIMRGDA